MKRLIRCYRIPLWLIVLLVIASSVAFAGWADEHRERVSDESAWQVEAERYERQYERMSRMAIGAAAAQAITMQGRQYEAAKAGGLDADLINAQSALSSAYGKQGALTQQLNDANARICHLEQMLRDNGVRLYQRQECEGSA